MCAGLLPMSDGSVCRSDYMKQQTRLEMVAGMGSPKAYEICVIYNRLCIYL